MSADGINTPCAAHDRDQAIVPATKVHRLGGKIHTDARRERKHFVLAAWPK
jgi:hypothetical protein